MKVLFCAYDRPGYLATGPNAWLQRLVPDLINRYEIEIHTLFLYRGIKRDCPTITYFRKNNLKFHLINQIEKPYIEDQVKAILKLVKILEVKIVVANLVIPALYATRYLKKNYIPVIGVLHSNDNFYKNVISKFINGYEFNQLEVVVAVSSFIQNLARHKTSTTKVYVIPCGTPIPKKKTEWNNGKVLKIIYAGRIVNEQKGILKLANAFLNAAEKESRLFFSIYGDGSEVDKLNKLVESRSLKRVQYKGAVTPSKILDKLREHQVFTLMSDYEGMPVALMEAMACGLVPVCLEEESGVNEIVQHGVNGFIVKNRDEDYQRHLLRLLNEPGLWQLMSQNARETIRVKYSTLKTNHQWYEVLKSCEPIFTEKLKIPHKVYLEGESIGYGDIRKPSLKRRIIVSAQELWLNLRLLLRPRTRLRNILKYYNRIN